MTPPTPNRCHRKSPRVMIGPDIHESRIAPDIVNAIRVCSGHVGLGEVMPAHLARLSRRKPLLVAVVVIPEEFFLLRIHRNHRPALLEIWLHGGVDVSELRIPIGMILPLLGLAVALQTVAQMVKDLGHFGMADGMLAPGQGIGDGARTLASPAQRRFGITSRLLIDEPLQPVHQQWTGNEMGLATRSRTADTPSQRHPGFQFLDSLTDRLS